jgi:hypothetical protein
MWALLPEGWVLMKAIWLKSVMEEQLLQWGVGK